jgi:hypothetical protein
LADKQQDEFDNRNVYDAFGELKLKPSPGATLEEDVTSRIKAIHGQSSVLDNTQRRGQRLAPA